MTRREHRVKFTHDVALLLQHGNKERGWEVALHYAYRSREEQWRLFDSGVSRTRNGQHPEGLAVDLVLYIDGRWQTRTEAYTPLGMFWQGLDPMNGWGGSLWAKSDFYDGGHFQRTDG